MANKITDKKRKEMFETYCDKQSYRYVAHKCSVSAQTVRRYCEKDNWNKRIAEIKTKTEKKIDNGIAKERARWARLGKSMQAIYQKKFFNSDGSLNETVVKKLKERDAVFAGKEGIEIERRALGEADKHIIVSEELNDMSVQDLEKKLAELNQMERELKDA